jgi:hypothetical protein
MSKGLNIIDKPIGIDLKTSTRKFYSIEISAMNGRWIEYLATELVPEHVGISEKVVVFDCRYKECNGEVKMTTPGFEAGWALSRSAGTSPARDISP